MSGPIITTTRIQAECEGHPAGPCDPMGVTVYCDGSCRRMYRAEIGEQSLLHAGRSMDETTNHLQAARRLRDDLGLPGTLHGRQEAADRHSWSVGWVREVE